MADEASEKPSADSDAAAPESAPPEEKPSTLTPGEEQPVKRKKKKRKKAAPEAEVPALPKEIPLTADGRERPVFLLAFPSDPDLDRLVRAFELGNYAFVREHAPKLAERADAPEDVRQAARDLARRIEPDPLIKILLALSVTLLIALTVWAYKKHGL